MLTIYTIYAKYQKVLMVLSQHTSRDDADRALLYWDVWTDVLDNAIITGDDGIPYLLFQDNDLWLIPAGMEWSNDLEFFAWPEA